jgi:hypothetical protein
MGVPIVSGWLSETGIPADRTSTKIENRIKNNATMILILAIYLPSHIADAIPCVKPQGIA